MFKYKITKGMWDDFFNFDLPDLFFSRKNSRVISFSKDYSADSKMPNSIIGLTLYNPTTSRNGKVVKYRLWFDPEKKVEKLNHDDYFKMSEFFYDEREILEIIGVEMKLIVYGDSSCEIRFKDQSNYSFTSVLTYLEKIFSDTIPYMENYLKELLEEDLLKINDFITLKLEETLIRVYCKERSFWVFALEDIRKFKPLILEQIYKKWFATVYLPQADDPFKPRKLEFSEVCRLFQDWNNNGLKNIHFTYHFYSHLMGCLIKNGHPLALEIYKEEVQKNEKNIKNYLTEAIKTEGYWNEFFDFNIPEKFLKKEIYLSTWKSYSYDSKLLIPRSIINLELYPEKTGSLESQLYPGENLDNNVFVISYYLEKENELKEIDFEKNSYFKYIEFLTQRDNILMGLGETIRLFLYLDKSFILHFFNSGFLPEEVIFPDFKQKLESLILTIIPDF